MQVEHDDKIYTTKYFPFFRIERNEYYQVFGIRYPSGSIEKVMVIDDDDNVFDELRNYLLFLIKEYICEDDIALTQYGQRLKGDVYELFNETR